MRQRACPGVFPRHEAAPTYCPRPARLPALLLLDEPTNGLDPDIALTVRALIRSLANEGTAILLTSHLLGEIEDLAHTITVLGAGSVAVSGNLEDVAAHAGIAATTVVQVEYRHRGA